MIYCMKEILKTFIVLLIVGLWGQQSIAQMSTIHSDQPKRIHSIKGDYFFDHQNFNKAIEYYANSVKEKPQDTYSMLRMAEAYHKTGDIDSAFSWYQKALKLNTEIEAAYMLKYMFLLLEQKKYDEARNWTNIYHDKLRIELTANAKNNVIDAFRDTTIYTVKNLEGINSADAESDPLFHQGKLFFASDRFSPDELTVGTYNLYSSAMQPDGGFGDIKSLNKILNSELNEGPFAIAQQTNTLYFTRNDALKGAAEASMSIFYSDVPASGHEKPKIKQLSFKQFNYNIGHPTLNSDGTVMYFVADTKKEGRGFDLYKSEFKGKNWTTPQALASSINTNGNEVYPFLHHDSTLYFASNGHGGLGGYDVYKINVSGKSAQLENLGSSVNTSSDEYGLVINENTNQGFLSSNRSGGLGSFDIYELDLYHIKIVEEAIADDAKPAISMFTSSGDEITLIGKSNENFSFGLETSLNYSLSIDKVNYMSATSMEPTQDVNLGGSDETVSTLELSEGEMYTFDIDKFVKVEDESSADDPKEDNTDDITGNPGDLITFRFLPNISMPSEQNDSQVSTMIHYKQKKVSVNSRDTIVFGYVVEELPKAPESEQKMTAAGKDTDVEASPPIAGIIVLTEQALEKPKEVAQPSEKNIVAQQEKDVALVAVVPGKNASNEKEIDRQSDSSKQKAAVVDTLPPVEDTQVGAQEKEPAQADLNKPEEPLHSSIDEQAPTNKTEKQYDIQYRVQIAASKVKLNPESLKKIYPGNLTPKSFEEDGYFKYYIALGSNYFAAKQILKESGVKNGFIVAYVDGEKRSLSEAIDMQYKERTIGNSIDEKGAILKVVTVNFKINEIELSSDEKLHLQEFIIDPLRDQKECYAIVSGHTDASGSNAYNYGLSEERTLFVRKLIVDEGINADRVKIHSFGESQLAKYSNENENGEVSVHQANRKVKIILLTTKVN